MNASNFHCFSFRPAATINNTSFIRKITTENALPGLFGGLKIKKIYKTKRSLGLKSKILALVIDLKKI